MAHSVPGPVPGPVPGQVSGPVVALGMPRLGPSPELVDDCVHCGFCLPACPTYVLWGEEADSPRGRIHLMKQANESGELTASMVTHWDACLGCMACVTACPSGVQYDKLIEATRAQVEDQWERSWLDRAMRAGIFALFPHPRRLRALAAPLRLAQTLGLTRLARSSRLLRRLAPGLSAMADIAPRLREREQLPERVPAVGTRRARVGLLTGCVQAEFFPEVNAATARVLAAEGCEVVIPPRQGCCGALSAHNGRHAEAARYARALVEEFEAASVDVLVVNAAGCGSTMKEYADLLAHDPAYAERAQRLTEKVSDVSEYLAELVAAQGPRAPRHPLPVTVAYHDACHLAHAQGIRAQPRELLRGVPGLELREIADADICCGSAGVYNVLHPAPARELGDRKAANVLDTGAELLVTANPGCLMQVGAALRRAGREVAMAHTIEVLDASIRGLPPGALGG